MESFVRKHQNFVFLYVFYLFEDPRNETQKLKYNSILEYCSYLFWRENCYEFVYLHYVKVSPKQKVVIFAF